MNNQFPQYRKYKNGKSWFCIHSPVLLEEIQQIGSRFVLHTVEARILPDRNLINDLLTDFHAFAEEISREEYESVKAGLPI